MDPITLLRECQGQMTLTEFAQHIGISRSMLSMIFLGQRKPGRIVLTRLARAFPDKRKAIIEVFLPSNGDDREGYATTATEPQP